MDEELGATFKKDTKRRLAAIMFTDIVGYTALTQTNEALALDILKRHNQILRPFFPKYRGREVKTIGDSFLVEFDSALDAVNCAIEIQKCLHDYNNSATSDNRKIKLRIGIHLGDVIHEGDDIFGDAVNIASRIEPIANPDSVCVSRQVYDQVHNKIAYPMNQIEETDLKNVKFQTQVYSVLLPWEVRGRRASGISEGQQVSDLDRKRIAILPFINISPDPKDEYFADGLTEELIATMSKISGLKVIARTSVMGYKGGEMKATEIAKELGVGTILEGSVRKAGDRLRITAQLIDARSGNHLWAESYDRNLKDVFAIQTEISEIVVEALKITLLEQDRSQIEGRQTAVPEAFTLYLRGRAQWNTRTEEGVNRAIKFYEEALARDPRYALALVGLADCYSILGVYGYRRPSAVFPEARELALKAISLDENLAEARAALSETMTHYFYDWTRAELELKRAIELNSNYSQAHSWFGACLLAAQGKLEDALIENRKAEELDPRSPIIVSEVGRVLYFARRYDEALEQYRKALRIDPTFVMAHKGLADVYAQKLMLSEALAEIEEAVKLSKGSVFILDDLGYVYARSGRREKALQVLSQLEELSSEMYVPEYGRAMIYVGLGNKNMALEWLQKAYQQRCLLTWLKVDPIFDPLRDDRRFEDLLANLGLSS
jgi:adenylate cyclase